MQIIGALTLNYLLKIGSKCRFVDVSVVKYQIKLEKREAKQVAV